MLYPLSYGGTEFCELALSVPDATGGVKVS